MWIMWKEVIHIIHIYWLQIMPFFELSTLSTLLFCKLSTLSTLGKVFHIFRIVFHIFVIKRLIKVPIYYRIDKYKTCSILIESVFFALSIVTLFYIYLNTGVFPGNPQRLLWCTVKENPGSLPQTCRYDSSGYCQWRCDPLDAAGFRTWKYYRTCS